MFSGDSILVRLVRFLADADPDGAKAFVDLRADDLRVGLRDALDATGLRRADVRRGLSPVPAPALRTRDWLV